MKRSEMIKKINDYFYEIGRDVCFGSHDNTDIFYGGYDGEVFIGDKFGEKVLDFLEKNGMLPPTPSHACNQVLDHYRWEEE